MYASSLKRCLGLAASILVVCGQVADTKPEPKEARRVAIIGAGAAGSSTAYFLRKFAREEHLPLDITIFEQSDYIGGRTTTVQAYGDGEPVELGGSIFVQVNYILQNASAELGLQRIQSESVDDDDDFLGIWDGNSFVFTQHEAGGWRGYWNIGRLLWKYGLAPIRTQRLMRTTVGRFLKLYNPPFFPFRSITARAIDLGLVDTAGLTGRQLLDANGVAEPFGTDIVQASTRVNYAQNLNSINGLLAMVCMAIEGATQIAGGNWQIFDRMVRASNASIHLNTSVRAIARHHDAKRQYTLTTHSTSSVDTQTFDTVVLAAPFQFSAIDTTAAQLTHTPDRIPYVQLHVTLLTSPHTLNPVFFGLAPAARCPNTILTTLQPQDLPDSSSNATAGKPHFYSISTLRTMTNPHTHAREFLYKIFSPAALDASFLSGILGAPVPDNLTLLKSSGGSGGSGGDSITWLHAHIWHSYPVEKPRVTFEEMQLGPDFYYTSAMETLISCMETSALAGKNVARLIADDVMGVMGTGDEGTDSVDVNIEGTRDGAHTEEL